MDMFLDLYTTLCYGFLLLSVLFLWNSPKIPFLRWEGPFVGALIFGFLSHRLGWEGLGVLSAVGLGLYLTYKDQFPQWGRLLSGMIVFALGVGICLHKIPGFWNLKIMDGIYLSPDGIPFTAYLNFDKISLGILILGLTPFLIQRNAWGVMFKKTLPKALLVILGVGVLAYSIGFIRVDLKFPECFWMWAVINLFFVCVPEEAFFRGFIQRNLNPIFENTPFRSFGAIFITSLLYGAFHYYGGLHYALLGAATGLGYGWVYQNTGRIEASILTHFGLNLVHFLCFTYPGLNTAV